MTAEALQSALGFTAADLDANRAGRLSDAQQSHLNFQSRRGKSLNLVMLGVFVAFVVIIVVVVEPKINSNTSSGSGSSSSLPPRIIPAVLAVVALIMLRTFVKTSKGMGNVATGGVLSVEGPATTKAVPLRDGKQLGGFVDDVAYRCYYVKGTLPVLISAEEI